MSERASSDPVGERVSAELRAGGSGGPSLGPVLLALAVGFGAGCGVTPGPAELATLERLGPAEIEPGEEIELRGSGFAVGPATLILVGSLSAPGQPVSRRRTRIELDAIATSETRAASRLGRRHFDRFGAQHATFAGRAVLRFASHAGPDAPAVTASLDNVRIELFANPTAHEVATRRARAEGRELLRRLGLRASVLPEGRGLSVEEVAPGSLAEHAGVQPGDVIVSAGSLTVASATDLAPPSRSRRLVLGVLQGGETLRRIAFPLVQVDRAPDGDRVAATSIALAALALLLVSAGPLRHPFRALAGQLTAGASGPAALLGALARGSASSPGATALSILVFAGAPFAVMALGWTSVVVVAGLAVLVSLSAAAAEVSGLRRLLAAALGALRLLPLALCCAVGAVRAASMNLDHIVAAQGHVPWQWEALSNPASLLLLVVVVAVTTAGESPRPGPGAAALRGVSGALLAAVLLGGWAAPEGREIAAQIAFAAKAWALGLCFPFAGRARLVVALPASAIVAAGAVAVWVLPLPEWAETAAPWSAAAAAVFLVAPLWGRWLLASVPAGRPGAASARELPPERAPASGPEPHPGGAGA